MIVTKTPLRISLGGGGTDLPFYANKFGGSLICGAINRYIYLMVGNMVQKTIKLNYSKTEIVDSVSEINHPLFREALKLAGITDSVEVHSMADIPSGTGLGSSGAFLVGLLNALYYYKGETVSKYKLAEDSSHIFMDLLKEPCGKQDQYASSFGSINHLKISPKGKVSVSPINISHDNIKKLERNLMMFFTGQTRNANEVLNEQKKKAEQKPARKTKNEKDIFEYYHEIKKIGDESKKCLENGNLRRFGEWMNVHWELKRGISEKMSTGKIDTWYGLAMSNGALGGKLIGAGGGGFLMFYAESNHDKLKQILEKEGLVQMPFNFDFDGSRVVYRGDIF